MVVFPLVYKLSITIGLRGARPVADDWICDQLCIIPLLLQSKMIVKLWPIRVQSPEKIVKLRPRSSSGPLQVMSSPVKSSPVQSSPVRS